MNHKKLFNFFAVAVVLCLALTGQAFAADTSQNITTRAAGVSVKGRVTSYLPGVSCTVQLRQGDAVMYSMASFPGVGVGLGTQEFIIPGVADGIYDLVITKPGHLSYTIRNIVVQGSDVDLTTNDNDLVSDISLVAGDINGDGCVDLQDLVILTSSDNFGKKPVVTVFDGGAEDNPEGVEGLDDFIYENTSAGIRITGVKDNTKTEYIVPKSVTSIANGAFSGCTNLQSITLPFVGETKDGTTNTHFGYIFGASAYANNKSYVPASLKTVVMTDGTSIGDYAFYNCTSLTSVTISNTVKSIGYSAFYSCRNLTNVTIGKSVESIAGTAFYGCTSLTSITIPDSVKSLGGSAFYGCTSLTSVTIGNGVTSIDWHAFEGCIGLTSITIGNSVTSIGQSAFAGCTGLTSITIPNRVTSIETRAFEGCTGLTSITIPDNVTSIGYSAFAGCTGLKSITIGNSVTSIDQSAFYHCTSLTSITIPDSVTSIGSEAFCGCTSLMSVTISDSVTSIGSGVFWNCTSLTSITIPDSVTTIGGSAFSGCSSLTSVTIPDSVTSIGAQAFYGCTGLTSITIPDSVTTIGGSAFSGCSSLTSITYGGTQAQWEAITKGDYWDYNTGNYTITYEGEPTGLEDFLYETTATGITITGVKDNTKTAYVIPDGVTSIGESAFESCLNMTSITIPGSVTSIGEEAFFACESLQNIEVADINEVYTSINGNLYTKNGQSLIQYATGKTDTQFTIPDGVTHIGDNAFFRCMSLTSVVIPDSVISIGNSAFDTCTSLKSITIPDSVTSIGYYAFNNCTSLTSVAIGKSVTSIGWHAFYGCKNLTSVTYGGTKAQWDAITEGTYWDKETGEYTITYNYTGE